MTACISTHCLLQHFNIRFIHTEVIEPLPMISACSHAQVQPDVNGHTAVAVQDSAGLTGYVSYVDSEARIELYLSSPA